MIRSFLAVLLAAGVAAAQHVPVIRSGPSTIPPAGAYRYGNILFPGGISPHQQTHAGRVGGVIQGNIGGYPHPGRPGYGGPGYGGPGYGGPGFGGRNRTVVVPYAVPVYYGDPYYGYGYGQAPPQQTPNVTVVVPQQPTPSVIINQHYTPENAKPVLREYSTDELPESAGLRVYEGPKADAPGTPDGTRQPATAARRELASDKPTIYLIALRDSTVRQAIGYWLEDGTVHYVTPQSTINHVSLDQVDREMSRQLNVDRGLEFELVPRTRTR